MEEELLQAQEAIKDMVERAFRQQEEIISSYVTHQERYFNRHLLQTRAILQAEYRQLGTLEGILQGADWRQAAGEIRTCNLERKVESVIKETKRVVPPEWMPHSFVQDHLRIMEMQVQEIFKLSTFAC